MTKKELILLRSGSEIVFEKLYNRYYKLIKQICFFSINNDEVAEDLTQETFIRLWNNKENINPNKNIKYYIITIANNLCNDYFRKQKSESKAYEETLKIDDKTDTDPLLPLVEKETFKRIKDILDQESYEILVLYYVHNLKYREIATIKNTTTSTITNKASRAIRLLKETLKNE